MCTRTGNVSFLEFTVAIKALPAEKVRKDGR